MALTPGSRLGPYEILGAIGSGGMGDVYRAHDARLDRFVAIKVLPDAVKDDPERRERFEREARAIAALNHPNIVTIHSVERAGDASFLTMELVEGKPLTSVIPRGGLPIERVLAVMIQVVDAIAAAHQKGITHRDLKPANIMVGEGAQHGRVKVLDFGLARVAGPPLASEGTTALPTALATGEGRILGTVAYMSPEQAEGKPVDGRSDLFALGVILYEMATGQRPFAGETSISIISAIVKDTPTSVTELNPALPRDFARIVKRALAKDPERRYQTAKDLRNDLEELKASLDSGELAAEARGRAVPARAVGLWRGIAIVAAVAALAAVAFVIFGGDERPTGSEPVAAVQLIPLTSTGNADYGAIAPDGKYVAYVQLTEDGQSLWMHQIASRSTVQIVPAADGVRFEGLTVTPDGSYVDFVRVMADQRELWRVPFLGGPARKLVDRVTSPPGWSPDGKQMAFLLNVPPVNAERQLIVADPDGSNQRIVATRRLPQRYFTLTLSNRPDVRPLWLPDGRSIAVRGNDELRPGELELIRVDVATGQESVLHQFRRGTIGGYRAGLAFASDPRWLIGTLSEEEEAPPQVVRLDLREGTLTKLTNDLASYGGIALAGDAVVTTRYERRSSFWIADATGRGERPIGREMPTPFGTMAWAGPSRLIYSARLAGGSGLWSMDVATGDSHLIVPNAGAPSVSADGKILVFAKGREIWRADADGTHAVRLNDALGSFPRVAPDGSRVYYISAQSGLQSTWVVDLAGGAPRQFSPVQSSGPAVTSPDGRLVMMASGAVESPGTFIMTVDGGEPVRRLPVLRRRGEVSWTPDSRGLMYLDAASGNLMVQPIDGGAPRLLTALPHRDVAGFAWSPDGKQLAFTRQTGSSNIVLLKGVK